MKRLILTAVMALAASCLLPLESTAAATTAVDVRVGTLAGIKAATSTPDGYGMFAATSGATATSNAVVYNASTGSTSRAVPLRSTLAPSLLAAAPSPTTAGDVAVLAVRGASNASTWSADLIKAWAPAVAAATSPTTTSTAIDVPNAAGISGGPVAAVAGNGYAYVELNNGTIVSVSLSDGTATAGPVVANPTLVGANAATQRGVLAISPSGGTLYVGSTVAGVGTVNQYAVNGSTVTPTGTTPVSSGTLTALYADSSNLYAAGTAGIGVIPASGASSIPLAAYPVTGMTCGALGTDVVNAQPYLDCAPIVGSTDVHLYRFLIPSSLSAGLTSAAGVPLSKAATGVWGVPSGGVYVVETDTLGYVTQSSLSTQPALKTFPQPPSNVQAAPISTTIDGSTSSGYGIWVSWTPPVIGIGDVTGYTVAATPTSGAASYCSNLTITATTTECLIPGLVAGAPYTVSVQSTSAGGASAAVLAPYKVNAGTPGPTISTGGASNCSASSSIVVPTYTLAKTGGTVAAAAVTVSWPGVSDQSCDPFTHKTITMGAHPVTYYVVSAIDTATNAVKTVNVPVGSSSSQGTYQGTITGLSAGKGYVFTVAANDSYGAINATTGLPPFTANWTGTATYAVPNTQAGSGGGAGASATVMDPTPSARDHATTGTYVPAGNWPVAYRSQAALYGASAYTFASTTPMDPSLLASAPTAPYNVVATSTSAAIAVSWSKQDNYADHLGWGLQDVVGYTATASFTAATGQVTTKTCTTASYQDQSCTISGLTNGNAYTVSVQAKSGVLGPAAYLTDAGGTRLTVMPAGLPAAPTAVTATIPQISPNGANQQWGTAVVKWTPPTDNGGLPITGYQIVAIPADTNLANTFTEYTCNPVDASTPLAKTLIDAQVASTPSLSAPVSWDPSALPISQTAIDPSHIFPTACESNPWGTNSYTFPVGSLSSQTTWTFKVAAHNAFGAASAGTASWGTLSAPSAKATPTGAPMPATKVLASMSATGITATWTAPSTTGGWALKGYQANLYRYDQFGNATWITRCTASTAQTSCTVPNVAQTPDGGSYFFRVQSYNYGQGQPADPVMLAGVTLPASNESAASNILAWYAKPPTLTVTAATPADKTIFVSWDPVPQVGMLDASNSPITLYTASATTGTTTKTCTAMPPATSCTITGLTNGTAYTVGITEANPGIASTPGYWKDPKDTTNTPTTSVSPGTVPDAPTAVQVHPSNLAADVWWTAPKNTGGVQIDYYTVSIVPGGAQCPQVAGNGPLTCHIDGLTNGINYTATVTAHNWFGTSVASAASAAFMPYGLSTPPINVQASPEDARATITWEAPIDDGGAAITSYQAVARPVQPGAGALRSCTTNAPTTTVKTATTITGPAPMTCTITGLTNGAVYTVDVVAVNLAGTSPRSGPTAPFIPVGAPDAPTGVFAYTDIGGSSQGPTTLHVAWNPSQNTGGSAIVRYIARANNGSSCVAEAGLTACDIDGLRAGVKYTVTVTATNLDGYVSKPSAASPPSVPAGPPSVPTDVIATGAQNAITVTWKASRGNGAAITQYVITVQPTGQVLMVAGSRTSAVISKLDASLTYQVTVQAQSGPVLVSGLSKKSNLARPYNTPNRISRPQAKAVKTGHRYKVLIGWSAPAVGGAPITGYLVRRVGGPVKTVKATARRAVFKGLKANNRYSFTVTPINKFGRGLPSLPVVVKTRG